MVCNGGKGRGSQVWCTMVARDVDRRYGVQWWQGSWIAGMVCNGGKGRGSQVWCTRNMGGGLMHVSSGCVLSCMYKCAVNGREAIAVIY